MEFNINPVAFTMFGIDVKWYGVLIAIGTLLGILIVIKECRRICFNDEIIIDLLLWMIPIGIICARLYYVAFEWDNYAGDIMKIINIRSGGLAIHGGLIGGVLTVLVFCKIRKISFWQIVDIVIPSVSLAQAIGRWGNFVNQEAHGGPTTLPWGILIKGQIVHPTFFYESICDICLFAFLMWYRKNKRKNDGEVFAYYLIFYSIPRFFIEGLRTDSLMFMNMRIAQLISVAMAITGVILLKYLRNKGNNPRIDNKN